MSLPREILPNRTHFISRRVSQRQFMIRPDARTTKIFAYCFAEAAERFGVGVCGVMAMSNHYHAIVDDRRGNLPAFLEHLHKMLAKALNARWGRHENLWSSTETSVVYLATAEDIFDKLVYVLSNPVAADLVDRLVDWPGFSSLHHMNGAVTVHERPKEYFRQRGGKMPERANLRLELPQCLAVRWTLDDFSARVREEVAQNERRAREERLKAGRRVMGRKAVLAAACTDTPTTEVPRNVLRPSLACKDHDRRILELAKLKHFRVEHERVRRLFVAGERGVEFPSGTYRMRLWGARCAPFPVAA